MHTIGIDIGGTKIKAGIIDQNRKILSVIEESTNKNDLIGQLKLLISQQLQKNKDIKAIGIATAGRVDFEEGSILYATSNLPGWTGTNVKQEIESSFRLPTIVDNDANCAAYAEHVQGNAQQFNDVMCMTLGTGVGAGIIINGKLFRGKLGSAGEIGHMNYIPSGRACNCGQNGCWEQYVSGNALRRDIVEDKILTSLCIEPKDLFELYRKGHPPAVRVINGFITHLAEGIMSLHRVLDLECYILGGGLIDSSQYWWDRLEEEVNIMGINPPMIKKAKLRNDAGMFGAAFLARNQL